MSRFLKVIFCSLLACLLSFPSWAVAKQASYAAHLKMGMASFSSQTENLSSDIYEFFSQLYVDSAVTPYWSNELNAEIILQAGSVQYAFNQLPGPRQGIRLRQAAFHIHDLNQNFVGSVGVFNPNNNLQWPNFRAIGFPGARLQFLQRWRRWSFSLSGLQTVATMEAASQETRDHRETPQFGSQAFDIYFKSYPWTHRLQLAHFVFSSLPSQAAHLSRFVGNSVSGVGPAMARFAYDFDCFGVSYLLSHQFTRAGLSLGYQVNYIENILAPAGRNKAVENSLFTNFEINTDLSVKSEIGLSQRGSDFFPAYYLHENLGSSNQGGFFARASLEHRPSQLMVQFFVSQEEPIRQSPYQGQFQFFRINLVQSYDIL